MARGRHYVEAYRDDKREWRWRCVHGNGNVMADSAEGYDRLIDCMSGAAFVVGLPFGDNAAQWSRTNGGYRFYFTLDDA